MKSGFKSKILEKVIWAEHKMFRSTGSEGNQRRMKKFNMQEGYPEIYDLVSRNRN